MKAVAQRGYTEFLVELGKPKGEPFPVGHVVDIETQRIHPAFSVPAIVSRGYWLKVNDPAGAALALVLVRRMLAGEEIEILPPKYEKRETLIEPGKRTPPGQPKDGPISTEEQLRIWKETALGIRGPEDEDSARTLLRLRFRQAMDRIQRNGWQAHIPDETPDLTTPDAPRAR